MNTVMELSDAHVVQVGEPGAASRRWRPHRTSRAHPHTTACHHPAIDLATTESEAVT
ncbi:hypothetical protein ACQEV4_39245 [Streptomyces shenzhenensis]|uniref:hypothetical protein n=1 Tax=Streptomyces shenzhenensis TaxID=943815 RepID=UPI003D8B0A3F